MRSNLQSVLRQTALLLSLAAPVAVWAQNALPANTKTGLACAVLAAGGKTTVDLVAQNNRGPMPRACKRSSAAAALPL